MTHRQKSCICVLLFVDSIVPHAKMTDKQPRRIMRGLGQFVIPRGTGSNQFGQVPRIFFGKSPSKDMPIIRKTSLNCERDRRRPAKWFNPALTCTILRAGEVYLFHRSDPACPAESSLWGVFDKRINGEIYLESSTEDLVRFRKWHCLPQGYRYCRLSTRAELRDYISDSLRFELRSLY